MLKLLALLLAAAPAPAPAPPAELILDIASGPYVDAVIGGVPLRLEVQLDHAAAISLNPEAAERAGLGSGDGKWTEEIGPVKLRGRFSEQRLLVAGLPAKAKIRWHQRVSEEADGLISIHLLPFERVTIARAAANPGERETELGIKVHDNHGVYVPLDFGKRRVAARLSFSRGRTTAPAAAAAVIAAVHGGVIQPERSLEEISLGVMRPVRPLRLQRPLVIGGLAVPMLMVRTADFRGDHELLLAATQSQEGEIVVAGAAPSQKPLYRITVGLDALGRCSSATYRRAARRLILRCLP